MALRSPYNWHVIKSKHSASIAVTEYSESFYESYQSTYQETSAVTNDFNHPSKDYVNFISTDFSAQMRSTQNDVQNGK